MTVLILVLSTVYVLYVLTETFYFRRVRKTFQKVIHVNGIRGKSTVTRLIDAGLRECGFRVFSKTTGTVPTTIGTDGNPKEVRRLGPANVREQLRCMEWAKKDGAEILVVECMAVNPELQFITEQRMLKADINVITNVRLDHTDVMGEDTESIAYSLANTTPANGIVVLGEDKHLDVFRLCAEKRNSKVVVAEAYTGTETLDTFAENVATALCVCEQLGLDRATFFRGMQKYRHDCGAMAVYDCDGMQFINAFSVNDPDSIEATYRQVLQQKDASDVTILLNTRSDRAFRTKQHIEMLGNMPCKKVLLIGSNPAYVARELKKKGIEAAKLKRIEDLKQEKIVFGCGNIAEDGLKVLKFMQENGEKIYG